MIDQWVFMVILASLGLFISIGIPILILAWKSENRLAVPSSGKEKLWIPIVAGLIALIIDDGYYTRTRVFSLTVLVIGIYYFSDLMKFFGILVPKREREALPSSQEKEGN